ncbi:MAG: EamA/RhaT family transporter [Acidimicrobiia bacterium]|nr:EamA/RhaT family transporter [Acidimicrobiia bacterium]
MSPSVICRLQLVAAAVLFSTGGAAIKATQFTGWQVAGFRSGIAAAALLLLLPESRRRWSPRVGLIGLSYAATLVLFVLANKLTTAANAIFLQSTAPLYLVIFAPWLLKERIHLKDWITLAAVGAGLTLFFTAAEAPAVTAPDPLAGNFLGAGTGLTWAITLTGLRWMASSSGKDAGLATVAAGNLTAFLICLPMTLPLQDSSLADWATVGYLGVFQIGLAYVLLTRGVRGVPALEVSLLLMIEPALNPVWAWFLHAEAPSASAMLGGALILGATVLRIVTARR